MLAIENKDIDVIGMCRHSYDALRCVINIIAGSVTSTTSCWPQRFCIWNTLRQFEGILLGNNLRASIVASLYFCPLVFAKRKLQGLFDSQIALILNYVYPFRSIRLNGTLLEKHCLYPQSFRLSQLTYVLFSHSTRVKTICAIFNFISCDTHVALFVSILLVALGIGLFAKKSRECVWVLNTKEFIYSYLS